MPASAPTTTDTGSPGPGTGPGADAGSPAPAQEGANATTVAGPASVVEPASRTRARLTIDLEHGVKQGSLSVLVDGRKALQRRLEGEETKKALVFSSTKGRVIEILEVSPGERRVRVEVREDGSDDVKAGLIVGRFERNETRILEVRVGSQVSLKWK